MGPTSVTSDLFWWQSMASVVPEEEAQREALEQRGRRRRRGRLGVSLSCLCAPMYLGCCLMSRPVWLLLDGVGRVCLGGRCGGGADEMTGTRSPHGVPVRLVLPVMS